MKKKIMLGTSDAWSMSRLSQRPSVLYWRLSDFYWFQIDMKIEMQIQKSFGPIVENKGRPGRGGISSLHSLGYLSFTWQCVHLGIFFSVSFAKKLRSTRNAMTDLGSFSVYMHEILFHCTRSIIFVGTLYDFILLDLNRIIQKNIINHVMLYL